MKLRKFIAKLFVILSTFFIVLSPIVLIEEAGHHCDHHDDCQICEVIRAAEENTRNTYNAPTGATVSLLIAIAFVFIACLVAISKEIEFNTPVSLKTKLTN